MIILGVVACRSLDSSKLKVSSDQEILPEEDPFPFVVSLQFVTANNELYTCSGSKLSQRLVLTAAHCISDILKTDVIWVNRKPQRVKRYYIHKKFDNENDVSEVAIYDMAAIEFIDEIAPLATPVTLRISPLRSGETIKLVGFGLNNITEGRGAGIKRYDLSEFVEGAGFSSFNIIYSPNFLSCDAQKDCYFSKRTSFRRRIPSDQNSIDSLEQITTAGHDKINTITSKLDRLKKLSASDFPDFKIIIESRYLRRANQSSPINDDLIAFLGRTCPKAPCGVPEDPQEAEFLNDLINERAFSKGMNAKALSIEANTDLGPSIGSGDSGGPLLDGDNRQVGIASYSQSIALGKLMIPSAPQANVFVGTHSKYFNQFISLLANTSDQLESKCCYRLEESAVDVVRGFFPNEEDFCEFLNMNSLENGWQEIDEKKCERIDFPMRHDVMVEMEPQVSLPQGVLTAVNHLLSK